MYVYLPQCQHQLLLWSDGFPEVCLFSVPVNLFCSICHQTDELTCGSFQRTSLESVTGLDTVCRTHLFLIFQHSMGVSRLLCVPFASQTSYTLKTVSFCVFFVVYVLVFGDKYDFPAFLLRCR